MILETIIQHNHLSRYRASNLRYAVKLWISHLSFLDTSTIPNIVEKLQDLIAGYSKADPFGNCNRGSINAHPRTV